MSVANVTEANEEFWRSVQERAMQMPYCETCSAFFFYPRPVCPLCWSSDVSFRAVSGEGIVWSYTVVHFAHGTPSEWHKRLPYVNALIDLSEGVRMMSNIIDVAIDDVRVGMPVRLDYIEIGDRTLPVFIPVREPLHSEIGIDE